MCLQDKKNRDSDERVTDRWSVFAGNCVSEHGTFIIIIIIIIAHESFQLLGGGGGRFSRGVICSFLFSFFLILSMELLLVKLPYFKAIFKIFHSKFFFGKISIKNLCDWRKSWRFVLVSDYHIFFFCLFACPKTWLLNVCDSWYWPVVICGILGRKTGWYLLFIG